MKQSPSRYIDRRILPIFLLVSLTILLANCQNPQTIFPFQTSYRRLPISVYRKKMMAGWLGQMVGVSFGSPTEFQYLGKIIPVLQIPKIYPGIANQAFDQDDLYVEMTFLHTLEQYGLDVSGDQAGLDFANSEYPLWHANSAGRLNLRSGIAPPDSGHPFLNPHADDIDYQIESDFAGLISPGLPVQAIQLGNTFGRLMNYGDGLYGGQFFSCMYSEAFFENKPEMLVKAGLACIPAKSQYAEAVRDVLNWWHENPQDWQVTWERIQTKYQNNVDYRKFSCSDPYFDDQFNIDAKINGAYVVMGLLYGAGDPFTSMM
ncbi:MAG: ADP-ribosylglycohydrolase family protein, partial [Anaerolineaceae bacterium]|nr:ADP-ribosylglycohydrolase family protein [Anaerolineaceae bacterium]